MGFIGRLFGGKGDGDAPSDEEVDRMVERVIALNPRLRLARGHEARMRASIAKAVGHLRDLVAGFPEPRPLSQASWASDPYIRAFFGAADDVGSALTSCSITRICSRRASSAWPATKARCAPRTMTPMRSSGETISLRKLVTTVMSGTS